LWRRRVVGVVVILFDRFARQNGKYGRRGSVVRRPERRDRVTGSVFR
jgi:hypothetical protein